jgi:protein phosphatase
MHSQSPQPPIARNLIVRTGTEQNIGSRERQEDSVGLSDFLNFRFVAHGGVLGAVADGMGGFEAGHEASSTAMERFLKSYSEKLSTESIRDALFRALFLANDAILRLPAAQEGNTLIGTTFAAAVIHGNGLYWISVGDSRIYLIRKGKIQQLTTDHTVATELQRKVTQQSLSQHEADEDPDRQILTSYVGTPDLTDIDCNMKPLPMLPGDVIVICSDGLYRTLDTEEIAAQAVGHPQEIAAALIQEAVEKKIPAQDNMSTVVMTCEADAHAGGAKDGEIAYALEGFSKTARIFGAVLMLAGIAGLIWILLSAKK